MKIYIYKGFDYSFYANLSCRPLVDSEFNKKINVLLFDKSTKKTLEKEILNLEENDEVWITYEEYTLVSSRIDELIEDGDAEVVLYVNNTYPDCFPIPFSISEQLASEIESHLDGKTLIEESEECKRFFAVYNTFYQVNGCNYGGFYNFEYGKEAKVAATMYYPIGQFSTGNDADYNIYLNDDLLTYLTDLHTIEETKPHCIGVSITNGAVSSRLKKSLLAFCLHNNISVIEQRESLIDYKQYEQELIDIAKNDIGIQNFKNFRKISFYQHPDIDKSVVEISQAQIIRDIITQAELAYENVPNKRFRDIFITASTGAGKSVMFQIPAVYLAKKYNKLTIIIEPVKALMQDQKEKLKKSGYNRVEAFNSDLITQVEKEAVLKRIKDGEVDLLYLSPETLLSYSIETIVGDRDIGLIIIDEAHIVTTWGLGFRPDYWYLGGYINRLRTQIQTHQNKDRKTYNFPVCAFTATAINGGQDDSIGETIISLYMENPIKYIGYTRRDNIKFQIVRRSAEKLPKPDYESAKTENLNSRLIEWLKNKQKTIVYFPYASLAADAKRGANGFAGIATGNQIGIYTGRNIDEQSAEVFNEQKRATFEKFRSGENPVMYATKAFGMGVDVDDIENVYHYAATGNLCDYVQEIGRAARKSTMTGYAITDFYYNDLTFMKVLFGMSQIKQYQIKKVLEGIYDTYKIKNTRSFLISPESFTYIFNGNEDSCINQLKTSLLMIERDFYDKYNFKVLISRPQSIFTKAFVVIKKDYERTVLDSKYGKYFKFIRKGRLNEKQRDGSLLSDEGDVYAIDLKNIWEELHPNISFPQFKYWFFNKNASSPNKIEILPDIAGYFSTRQKVSIEASKEYILCDIRDKILDDLEYIANTLYSKYRNQYFSIEDFVKLISERFGISKARIIANSLFDLIDPNNKCIKHRNNESTGRPTYILSNGNLKEFLRRPITKSRIISNISSVHSDSYLTYMCLQQDEWSALALKLLSVFGYISYEVVGGEEPEIFIRINDPNKIRGIVMGSIYYSNNYVTRAKQKHDRDVMILSHFFNNLQTDEDRWNFIEEYFLGFDVLNHVAETIEKIDMKKAVDKEHSYTTNGITQWTDIYCFFEDADLIFVKKLGAMGIPKPEFLETVIKKSRLGEHILMSWPSKNILICQHETDDNTFASFDALGWKAYRVSEIDFDEISRLLR